MITEPEATCIIDEQDTIIVKGLLNAADAHYIVDAVNEYQMVREAKIEALASFKKYLMNLKPTSAYEGHHEMIKYELIKRIEDLCK